MIYFFKCQNSVCFSFTSSLCFLLRYSCQGGLHSKYRSACLSVILPICASVWPSSIPVSFATTPTLPLFFSYTVSGAISPLLGLMPFISLCAWICLMAPPVCAYIVFFLCACPFTCWLSICAHPLVCTSICVFVWGFRASESSPVSQTSLSWVLAMCKDKVMVTQARRSR